MKRVFVLFLCLLLIVTSVFGTVVSASDAITVKVGIYENSPKIFTDAQGNPAGFWPDILGYMASQEGWNIQWVHGTWAECLQRLQNGEIDIMPDVAYTDARSQIYTFATEPAYTSWSIVYTRSDTHIQSLLDLEGKNVAVLQGSVNYEGQGGIKQLVQSFSINCTFIEVDSYDKVFETVKNGGAAAGVTSKDYGFQHEKSYNLVETPIIFQPSPLYFAFPKNASLTPSLVAIIDNQVTALKADHNSIYYESLNKWFAQIPSGKSTIPQWVIWMLDGIGGLAIVFAAGVLILRSQVRSRTKKLTQEIAMHKQADEAIRQSEAKYATLVQQSNDGIIIIQNGLMVFVNRMMMDLTGNSMEETIGKPFDDFISPKYKPLVADRYRRRMAGEAVPSRYDAEIVTSKGSVIPVEINAGIIEYEGKPATMAVVRDMTEQNKMLATLRDRENMLSLFYDNVSDVIFVVDVEPNDNFRFKSVNRRFLEVTGLSENLIVGKLAREIIPESAHDLVFGNYKEAIKTGRTVHWEEISEYPTGTKYGEVTVVPVFDANGNCTQLIGAVHDITERKQADAELAMHREHLEDLVKLRTRELAEKSIALEQANIHLQEMDRLKSVFLASMSHELRTPLNSVIGFTGILLMGMTGDLNDEQKKQLTIVKNSAEYLLSLINDILDISKIEAGKVELFPEEFYLNEVVKELTEPLVPVARGKGLELIVNIPEPVNVFHDKRRVKQILTNLLSNAIKFTYRGSVTVSARVSEENKLEIRVTDTGIGIRKEDMGKLFQPFQQVGTELTKKYEGTGLGLYLTAKLAVLLGGSVSATSEYDKGSEFTCILPLRYKEES